MPLIQYNGKVSFNEYIATGVSSLWQPGQVSDIDQSRFLILSSNVNFSPVFDYTSDIIGSLRYIANPSSPPCLLPSLNGGTATATQSGTLITVTTSVAHNISIAAADRISNTGTKVYLNMAPGLIAAAWYDNIIVTGATTFTCVSTISQTAGSQTVNPLGSTVFEISPLKFSVSSGIAKAFSQIKYTFHITLPVSSVARGASWRMINVGHGNDSTKPFSSDNTTATAARTQYVDGLISFLNDISPHSDWIGIDFGGLSGTNNNSRAIAANGDITNIKPSNGFELTPSAWYFSGGTTISDWILFSMARYELLV